MAAFDDKAGILKGINHRLEQKSSPPSLGCPEAAGEAGWAENGIASRSRRRSVRRADRHDGIPLAAHHRLVP